MKSFIFFCLFILSFTINSFAQTHYPGGVVGADVWVIIENPDNPEQVFQDNLILNKTKGKIEGLENCGTEFDIKLFNYNYSIFTKKLCLSYPSPLENLSSASIFFVGNKGENDSYSHVSTSWRPKITDDLNFVEQDSVFKNHYDFATNFAYASRLEDKYAENKDHNINHLFWTQHNKDKKFKSYGFYGEAEHSVGKEIINPVTEQTHSTYLGNFPEYISFPFRLNRNQKVRVDSYLALKYGLTLVSDVSYKNSRNMIFWDKRNNKRFGNRIFGIGRDDISGVQQLQSQSMHVEGFLTMAIEKLFETNLSSKENIQINNDHFIINGDNGEKPTLLDANSDGVRRMQRVWLSEINGENSNRYPLFFHLDASDYLTPELHEEEVYWMLHDPHVNRQEESDFDNNHVKYYSHVDLDGDYAQFTKDIYFDVDENRYDQFTFGVGPKMIVQFQPTRRSCEDRFFIIDVVVTGGKEPYKIHIKNMLTGEVIEDVFEGDTFTFEAEGPTDFIITVKDATGYVVENEFELNAYMLAVDLGESVELTMENPTTELEAGLNIEDPEATYEWYKDGEPIDFTGATLEVNEAGIYEVVITDGDRTCEVSDTIKVYTTFSAEVENLWACDVNTGSISVEIFGGFYPVIMSIQQLNTNTNPIPDGFSEGQTQKTISGLDFGAYEITFADANTDFNNPLAVITVDVQDPMEGLEVDLLAQIEALNIGSFYTWAPGTLVTTVNDFSLDASVLTGNNNITYEWYLNNTLVTTNPILNIINNGAYQDDIALHYYEVRLINEFGCEVTDYFRVKGYMIPDVRNKPSTNTEISIETAVYPNPSAPGQTFYYEVNIGQACDLNIKLYDVNGKVLYENFHASSIQQIQEYNLLQSGVYFIHLEINGEVIIDKIIIR